MSPERHSSPGPTTARHTGAPRLRLSVPLLALLLLILAGLLGIRILMHRAFFHPRLDVDVDLATPADLQVPYETVRIHVPEGPLLEAWWMPNGGSSHRGAVLFLHGNALDRRLRARVRTAAFFHRLGYHVLSLDYRGYDGSEGSPSHEGLMQDTRAALAWLDRRDEVKGIVIYGHSLGGALALCSSRGSPKVRGVAAQGAFHSASALVEQATRGAVGDWLGGALAAALFDSPIEPVESIRDFRVPVLLLHGENDYVIPPRSSRILYERLGPERARLWIEPRGLHVEAMDVTPDRYAQRLADFLAETLGGVEMPGVSADLTEEGVMLACRGPTGRSLDAEVHLWGEGKTAWRQRTVLCPGERWVPDVAFRPEGAAALPALAPGHPTKAGRGILDRFERRENGGSPPMEDPSPDEP